MRTVVEPTGKAITDPTVLTAQIVAAFAANNVTPSDRLATLIKEVHRTLLALTEPETASQSNNSKPAVPVKQSVFPEYIICLEDGKQMKMLKRYLRSKYGMTPEQYRERWGLPATYPMVASEFRKQRADQARIMGHGRRRSAADDEADA